MLLGPVFSREAVTTPRRPRHYLIRAVYVAALLILMCTAWLVLAGTQIIRNVGDLSRFGAGLFQILAPLQLALLVFLAALAPAGAVSQEKDRRTLILLLMTRLSNSELVLGKLSAGLLNVLTMWLAALPVFLLATLFGGVSFAQVGRVFAVTFTTILAAGSLGAMLAFWREKTFQALAMTVLLIVIWIGAGEAVYAIGRGLRWADLPLETWVAAGSPLRAILAASQPRLGGEDGGGWLRDGVTLYLGVSLAAAALLSGASCLLVRVWNPSREARSGQERQTGPAVVYDGTQDIAGLQPSSADLDAGELGRAEHVDARGPQASHRSRRVWDNPVLWREICTWAYGRKVLIIRLAYLLFFALAATGLAWSMTAPTAGEQARSVIPAGVLPLAPLFLISLVIVNALAVTSITNERDGQSLDLLLVTDLSPREFVFGKLGGVFWVTKEMVLLPLLLCVYVSWRGVLSAENLAYLLVGLAQMYLFVNTLGIHCGLTYANSRTAIGVSLGLVFFLFLGVVTCMLIMIWFSGSFTNQLAPFLAFIIGGSVGLYVLLGHRNPSPAIQLAALLLPFATFYAVTSFLLHHTLAVFLMVTGTYGFATAAMLMPAIAEFDIAMGRTTTAGDE
ncbi:MAG: ABC transporter permease subunit [Planctomycetota bacterium]|nr:ABC transporter permease subunit [Planctomycetota bacterium]